MPPTLAGADDDENHEPAPSRTGRPPAAGEVTGAHRQVIRDATRAFRDPAAAEAAGYVPSPACAELPGEGGMGQHWINPDLLLDGGRIDPTMLGQPLDGPMPGHDADMPVHDDLHAWVYTNNPSGELAPWNPGVSCEVAR